MAQAATNQRLFQEQIPIPAFFPARVRQTLSGRAVSSERQPRIMVPAQVMRFVRSPEPLSVAAFAERHRYVADGAHPGRWRAEYAPHTVKIMETYGSPWVREVWFCGVDQSGKTNTMLCCLAWAVAYMTGHIFWQMAREEDVKKVVKGKIIPMIQRDPFMARYLSDRADDTGLASISLKNGKTIIPSHSGSPAANATWSASCTFSDEVDKYPLLTGGETSPVEVIRKRSRTFRGRDKHFFSSTPAGRFIYAGTMACQQVWEGRITCPHCGEQIRMDAEHLLLPEKASAASVLLSGCDYACNACGAVITEDDRQAALARGPWWACISGAGIRKPESVGFLHRAWDCHDLTLTQIAVAWLKSVDGNLAAKRDWAHGYEARDYEEDIVERREDYILRLVDDTLPRKQVPAETQALILMADTQKLGFRYQVWAVGWGQNPKITVIDRSFRSSFDELAAVADQEWLDVNGGHHHIAAAWIDSGGGTDPYHPKHSRTTQVYAFCKIREKKQQYPVFHPLKGRRGGENWSSSRLEFMPTPSGRKAPIPGGLVLYNINVTEYKNVLNHALSIEPGDPGSIRLYQGIKSDFAAQMCAEYQDERGFWVCPPHKANHDWDIAVYGMAAIDIMDLAREAPRSMENVQRVQIEQSAAYNQQQSRRRW